MVMTAGGQRRFGLGPIVVAAALFMSPLMSTVPPVGAKPLDPSVRPVEEVRSTYTSEFGVARPVAIAAAEGNLVVAGTGGASSPLAELTTAGDVVAQFAAAGKIKPGSLASDPATGELHVSIGADRVRLDRQSDSGLLAGQRVDGKAGSARSSTIDSTDGSLVSVDSDGLGVSRTVEGTTKRIPAARQTGRVFDAVAVHPGNGLVHLYDSGSETLVAIDDAGTEVATYDLSTVELGSVSAMAFAPSADATDAGATQHLYVADAGTDALMGRVVEVALVVPDQTVALAAPTVTGSLVRMVATSAWAPASPDPAGIVYMPNFDRLAIVDSEVEEVTGAGYHGVNLWVTTRAGVVTDTGTTHPAYSKEPTGLGAKSSGGATTLFISDDSKGGIHVVLPGTDNRFGTTGDIVTFINTAAYGLTDSEDPAYDSLTGHLFFLDGVNTEIYRLNPVDGVFGNGNDIVSHFDIGVLGATDYEALGADPSRGTLLVGARTKKKVYEITKTGELVQTIDLASASQLTFVSGLTLAPSSTGSGQTNLYIVDRAVDNGASSSENDGKLFEFSMPTSDSPPMVAITAPTAGSTLSGTTTITATASDNVAVSSVQFLVGTTAIGTDTSGADGWSVDWNTTSVTDGSHTLNAVATDSAGQTATSSVTVIVDNVDSPPSVSWTSPAAGSTITGTVGLTVSASDDVGVSSVQFSAAGTVIATDTSSVGGWTTSLDTTSLAEGAQTLTAVATDSAGQTATSTRSVVVDNADPSVAITTPVDGATVSGSTTIGATASDSVAVGSVEFRVDGSVVGTDTNAADGWSTTWNTSVAGNGAHTLTAIAADNAGHTATSASVAVTVDNGVGGELTVAIASGADDVEEKASNGNMIVTSTDLDMMLDTPTLHSAIGLRYTGISLPAGATVTGAYLQFGTDEVSTTAVVNLTIGIQDVDNAPVFTTAKRNVTSRVLRSGTVAWAPPAWPVLNARTSAQATADLSALIQGVIDRPGWIQGNAIAFVIKGTGTGTRIAGAFENGTAPTLHIVWTN